MPNRIVLPDARHVSGEDLHICNVFNRAARDIRRQTPELIRAAFDNTLTRLGHSYDRQRIMQALVKGGLRAPSAMMPKGFELYGSDVAGRKQGTSHIVHGALTGMETPRGVPPAFMIPARAPRVSGLAELRLGM